MEQVSMAVSTSLSKPTILIEYYVAMYQGQVLEKLPNFSTMLVLLQILNTLLNIHIRVELAQIP